MVANSLKRILKNNRYKILIFKGELNDLKGLASDVSGVGHWGNGDYRLRISNDEDLDYIFSLVKQSYKKNSA